MSGVVYVHGHPRDLGWVMAHRRRPHDPDAGQLGLPLRAPDLDAVGPPILDVPMPRVPTDAPEHAVGGRPIRRVARKHSDPPSRASPP